MDKLSRYLVKHRIRIIWILLLLAIIVDRAILLHHFTLQYLDDDQAIMWNGALEYSKGNFFEPYFFGQTYNTMLESLLAIPLIKMGFSYAFSLTFIMSLLTLLPFALASSHYLSRKNFNASLVILCIPLLLPPEFGMLTAISRGAICGIFIAFFGIYFHLKEAKGKFFFFSFFSFLALVANPNSILLIFPFGVIYLYRYYKQLPFYIYSLLGAIIPLSLGWLAGNFYKIHPEYVVHRSWALNFELSRIVPAKWYLLFGDITPLFWYTGLALFPILLLFVFIGKKQKNNPFVLAVSALTLLIFVAITCNKVHDGIDSVFYSSGRMFLAIPLVLALFLSELRIGKTVMLILVLAATTSFTIKLFYTEKAVQREVSSDKAHNMFVIKIDVLKAKCAKLKRRAKETNAELIVVHHSIPEKHLLNYACPCLIKNLPHMIEPELDRRTWKLKAIDHTIFKNILVVGINQAEIDLKLKNYPDYKIFTDTLLTVGIFNNQLPTELLLQKIGFPMRNH